MECICGYNDSNDKMIRNGKLINVKFYKLKPLYSESLININGKPEIAHTVYACPVCGTLKIEV